MASFTGRCKKCGGTEIASYDSIIGTACILGFDENKEPDYDGYTEVAWDTQQPYDAARPYQCQSCWELLSADDIDLIPEDEEESKDGSVLESGEPGQA
jgi:hypothetical protein